MSPPAKRPVAYLIRAWAAGSQPDDPTQMRFLAERIGEVPQRQGFEHFDDLVAFLRVALLEDAPGARDDPPLSEAC
jgi:hypothetical protein